MKIDDLKATRVVTKDGRSVVPYVAIAGAKLFQEAEKKFKDNIIVGKVYYSCDFINLSHSRSDLILLATSIDDINF